MKRTHLIISGHVQGVGFRYFCLKQAEQLGLAGYARNRSDGSVEVEAQGEDAAIEAFVSLLKQGPRIAHVTNIERIEAIVNDDIKFRVL
jgi:acylphosphatase